MDLKVDVVKKREGYYIVSPKGSIDSDTYILFEDKLGSAVGPLTRAIVLDMGGVAYISSIGFSVIFRAKQDVEAFGGKLVIANLQPNVKKIFDAVKAIPASLFVTLKEADEYLDAYIKLINGDGSGNEKKK